MDEDLGAYLRKVVEIIRTIPLSSKQIADGSNHLLKVGDVVIHLTGFPDVESFLGEKGQTMWRVREDPSGMRLMVFVDLGTCNTCVIPLETLARRSKCTLYKFAGPLYNGPGLTSCGDNDIPIAVPHGTREVRDSGTVELIWKVSELVNQGSLAGASIAIFSKDKSTRYLTEKLVSLGFSAKLYPDLTTDLAREIGC